MGKSCDLVGIVWLYIISTYGQQMTLAADPVIITPQCENSCDGRSSHAGWRVCSGLQFCCGDIEAYYCCEEPGNRLAGVDIPSCQNTWGWWSTNWQVIVGLLVAAVLLVALTSACYYGCVMCSNKCPCQRAMANSEGDRRCDSITSEISIGNIRSISFSFDPESPYAFRPPAYSLPMNPPSYIEILKEYNNEGLSLADEEKPSKSERKRKSAIPLYDILSATGQPPPAYTAAAPSRTRRHSCATPTAMADNNRRKSQASRRRPNETGGSAPRRRSTTCIAPNFNADLPPLY